MKQNICKFNFNRSSDLICESFIYETKDTQSVPTTAKNNVMNIVTKGKGWLCLAGQRYDISEGTVFFLLRGDVFSVISDAEIEYSYISFIGRRGDEYIERLKIDVLNRVFHGYGRLVPFWLDSICMCDEGNIDVLSEAVLLYSIATLTPDVKEKDDFLSTVIKLTHDNFTDSELTVGKIAEEVGYSSKYISTVFKKRMGISYTEYLRELRIKHSVFLIENGVVSVKNLALLCGYHDALYFSKVFSKVMGKSPRDYIKNLETQTDG